MHAHLLRLRALIERANAGESKNIGADLSSAIDEFRIFGTPFYLAKTLLERGTREDVDEAHAIFTRLDAKPWLEKIDGAALIER